MEESRSWLRRHKILTAVIILAVLFFIAAVSGNNPDNEAKVNDTSDIKNDSPNNKKPVSPKPKTDSEWDSVRAADVPQLSGGWSAPVRLAVTEDGMWHDSLFVTPDGSEVYFIYYPGDLFSDIKTGTLKGSGVIYTSRKPFTEKTKDPRKYLNEPPWSAAGPTLTADGDMYYHSNRPIPGDNNRYLSHIYKNGDLLPFNNPDVSYNNPHYCAAKDELWFDRDDHEIYVLKNARASGFKGAPQLAPRPINSYDSSVKESQPWLSEDCNTIYFNSSRDRLGAGPAIYASFRTGDDQWDAPQVVVKSKIAVGEPTLTSDMKRLFFIQVLQNTQGNFTTNLFYSEKK